MNLRKLLICLLPFLIATSCFGQVKVSVILDQQQFLPGEDVPVKVRIINHSGQTLFFGENNQWLRVSIQAQDSFVVRNTGDVPVRGVFELPPSKMATKELNIAPYFDLNRPGRYEVVATVRIEEWNQTITSMPASFDVISGSKLWERTFGVPDPMHSDGPPVVRKYLLQQANHLRTQVVLYVRITDAAEEHTIKVIPIGPMVSFSEPRAVLDGDSNLHVLYQSGPQVFTYFEINPNGMTLQQERYEYSGTRPRLFAAEDGAVTVKGGVKVPKAPSPPPAVEPTNQTNEEG